MRKLIVLVEALALATCIVAVASINPQTVEMVVAASQAANHPEQNAIGKIIVFAQTVGNVAMSQGLTYRARIHNQFRRR
jgi:hypothetical protein